MHNQNLPPNMELNKSMKFIPISSLCYSKVVDLVNTFLLSE